LWSFAEKINGQLLWCLDWKLGFDSNLDLTVPVAVQGDTDKPFLLVSFPGPEPNLHAVGIDQNVTITQIDCIISPVQLETIFKRLEQIDPKKITLSNFAASLFKYQKFL